MVARPRATTREAMFHVQFESVACAAFRAENPISDSDRAGILEICNLLFSTYGAPASAKSPYAWTFLTPSLDSSPQNNTKNNSDIFVAFLRSFVVFA